MLPMTFALKWVKLLSLQPRYCNQYVDRDALMYLIMANDILPALHPNIVTIAEDATYYPGLCEPTFQGGLGFDHYVNVSASEMWLSYLENVPDNEWSISKIVTTLMINKLHTEKMILCVENHNQLIRLITFTIGGRAYLNFMGNEFGHPKGV